VKKLLVILFSVCVVGCTDAERSKFFNYGNSAEVKCYSGGVLIYSGYSSGKVVSYDDSTGYMFRTKSDGTLMKVSGDCVITYK